MSMHATSLLIIYCFLVLIVSLAGGWIPMAVRLTHKRMELAASLVAGFMLGVGVMHLLPQALATAPSVNYAVRWFLIGFLTLFFVERCFGFHHHETPADGVGHRPQPANDLGHGRAEVHSSSRDLTWSGAAVGLALHSLINGVALAAAIGAESGSDHGRLAGLAVFLAIVLHKPFDAMTLGALMAIGGWSLAWRHLVNGVFALCIPIGAAIFYFGFVGPTEAHAGLVGCALAFSAGTFLCIATSDLLPELQFHQHDRVKLSAALLLGLALAWGIDQFAHGGHNHEPVKPAPSEVANHADHPDGTATGSEGEKTK